MKLLFPIGTTREAITLAPVIQAMLHDPGLFEVHVCLAPSPGEGGDPADVLSTFGIEPDYDLGRGPAGDTLAQQTARMLEALDPVVVALRPDWILVQGDATTALAGGLVAYYRHVRLAHVEAGLRTHSKFSPFPAEVNRRVADLLADLYFAPTERDGRNLAEEGVDVARILVTGSTAIDALQHALARECDLGEGLLEEICLDRRVVLVAARHVSPVLLADLERVVRQLAAAYVSDIHLVFLAPRDPEVLGLLGEDLEGLGNLTLLPQIDWVSFAHLLDRSHLVLTDSDGIQEEASSLGKPVLVMRNETERLEALVEGSARIVGTDEVDIIKGIQLLLDDSAAYSAMARRSQIYGDGRAADRIAYELERRWEDGGDV